MPIQYNEGILKEHLYVREHAGLFDVSHMGQALLTGNNIADFINKITPSQFHNTPNNTAKYTVLTNDKGGIIDDLIITKINDDEFFFVYNSGTKEKDEKWITSKLPSGLTFKPYRERSLLALQGPDAEKIITKVFSGAKTLLTNQKYMTITRFTCDDHGPVFVSRLGYTGEDGFEISVLEDHAVKLWDALTEDGAKPIGLGARDSLRLEMGYPLYGHDINDDTTPLEANLGWVIPKAARETLPKPKRLRVGFILDDKSIIREGIEVLSTAGKKIGKVTSGGFSPTLQKPIAQGYVETEFSATGTPLIFELRGRQITGKVGPLNFIQPKTKSGK